MCVVPVVIKHKDSDKEIITHAILDSCRQGTFILEDLVNGLETDGIDTSVVVKTLNWQSRLKSKLVNGLAVSTPEKLRRWQYLQTIASETVQNPSVPVGLLIGANFLSVLELTEFIGSKAGGPYAYKTKLGWCIVSSIDIEGIRTVFVLYFFMKDILDIKNTNKSI